MILTIENPVYVSVDDWKQIKPVLSYESVWYKQGKYHKERKVNIKSFVKYKRFLVGFLPRIEEYLTNQKIEYEVKNRDWLKGPTANEPFIKGITFRPDQYILLEKALSEQRGVILSPTGSGKTIIAMGLMSCYPESNILFLCHSLDIIQQTVTELEEKGFKDVCMMGGGSKEMKGRIVVSSIQTFVKLEPDSYIDRFDVVIVDEVHHVSGESTLYGQVLSQILAPVRIGFTATMPEDKYKRLCIEGFLGPVIGEFKIEDGVDLGILAKPIIKLLPVPKSKLELTRYIDIYDKLIVNNRTRNRIACSEIVKRVRDGKSCLIMVKEIRHGENIEEMLRDIFKIDCIFIHGSTEKENRLLVKSALEKKKMKAVICTSIWKEGVNIRSLSVIVNCAGGKSEIATLQAIGRGLRTTEEKDSVEILDFLDDYKYLSRHSIARISIYAQNNWL